MNQPSNADPDATPTVAGGERTGAVFATTHWSVVLAAGQPHSPLAQEALARLCETYRAPLLAYAQALRLKPEDAEDATQAFFVHFLTHNLAGKLERHSDVKFRSFLLRCFRNFLSDERARRQTQRRGGGQPVQSLDDPAGAQGIPWEPADEMTAARAYERRWATALLDHVLARLEGEYRARGRGQVFEQLHVFLLDKKAGTPYAEVARQLSVSADAVKKEVSRMRQRYRELFREEIAHTVATPGEVDEEINYLFRVLSG